MRMRRLISNVGLVSVVVCLLAVVPLAGMAQSDGGACPALVQQALTDLGQNCDSLDRNSACYGYNRVDATFHQSETEDFFSKPADRSQIANLQSIATAPLDVNKDFWGIAVMNVQANVPNTLPGQAVTFVLLGDVKVDNAVAPEDVTQPVDPINVTTLTAANIRSGPTVNANIIGSVPNGKVLPADGRNDAGDWYRIVFSSGPGWVNKDIIYSEGDLNTLPVINKENRSPMQSFFFTTGVGDPACNAAPPSLLVVQGPDNVKVNITANGADITIGSTIALMILPGNILQLIVVHGEAKLGDLNVPAGFKITAQLSDDGKSIVGGWEDMSPLTQEDLDLLKPLEGLPPNILHYPIVLPSLADIQAILNAFQGGNSGGGGTGGPGSGQADCTTFAPTSPLDGLPFGTTTFYWNPAPGATTYQVNLYNDSGALVGSFQTDAANTSLEGDTSGLGGGFSFSWQVVALVNGQVACSSAPITMFRETPKPANQPGQPMATEEFEMPG
ncbi:MAG: SH3 domain-containing protein [Chloroflexota bacterium]